MKTGFVIDNHGNSVEVIVDLKKGDKLFCHTTQRSTSGVGFWSTDLYDSFEKGKTYQVYGLYNWHGVNVAYVLDEDATCCWAMPGTFTSVVDTIEQLK